jgi:hypothetical protein
MAKQKIQDYVFLPGVSSNSNAYPNAYSLIKSNRSFILKEAVAYINAQIVENTASNLYPNAVALLTANKQFIIDETIAWIAYRVTNSIAPFAGYTYSQTTWRANIGLLVDALIYDSRYGGNKKTIDVAKSFWMSGTTQLTSPTQEIPGFNQIFSIIVNNILTKTAYSSQQSPVTSTQTVSGNAAETGVAALITGLQAIIINVIPNGLSVLPTVTYSTTIYAGYVYDSSRCDRDIGMVVDAYLHDLRYGGNAKTRYVSSRFWNGSVPQIAGNRRPEITAQQFVITLINTKLLTQASYTPLQTAVARYTNNAIAYESASVTRITSLSSSFISVLTNGLESLPTLVNGVTTIKLQGRYKLETLLMITNTTSNQILYNFVDPTLGGAVTIDTGYVSNNYYQDDDFQSYRNIADYTTTLILEADTSSASLTDDIQIFVEAKEQRVRPYDFGTDAIERHRVAQAQSMLDADFEYGLQPTKWQAIGLSRGYPSVYEVPGTDTPVVTVVTDASAGVGGTGVSLITVTTTAAHGFTIGTPITIKALANSISGFSRAEGTFLINSVPTTTSFTYHAVSKVGTTNGDILATTYTQLRKGSFYTGASIGSPTFSVSSNGTSTTCTTSLITVAGTNQITYTGTTPAIGSPLIGTGIRAGTQVSGTVGATQLNASLKYNVNINDTSFTVANAAGILEGMGIDNGSGTAIFVSSVIENTVNVNQPITTFRVGDSATYTNISGTNVTFTGSPALFNVNRINGTYDVSISSGGTGFQTGNRILILGTVLGGSSPTNDLLITATTSFGIIQTISISGTSITGDTTYTAAAYNMTSSLVGISATFDVYCSNLGYSVVINNVGSGYEPGETLTILGSYVGGSTPANDLEITIQVVDTFNNNSIVNYTFVGTPRSSDASFGLLTGTNIDPAGINGSFNFVREGGSYTITLNGPGSNYYVGDQILMLGTNLGGTSPANDATILITGVDSNEITTATVTGTSVTGETITFYSSFSISESTSATIPASTVITASPIATILVTFLTNHGLVPGTGVSIDIASSGTNHVLAKGPFYVEKVPSPTTFLYTARATGTIDTGTSLIGTVYTRSDSFFMHRPYDGGVQLGSGGPQHGAQAIRMSKKYIRYQSGKGINYCTGALFAPSFNIQSMVATAVTIGSYITIVLDDVDHGCQSGGVIRISNVDTIGFNGTFVVSDIISERVLRVQAQTVLMATTAVITTAAIMSVVKWHGSTVRAGTFDDQNGIFFQYNGQEFAVGRRTATLQLAGVANITKDTNLITGTNTRFRDQIKAGDRIVIKGMTHVVTSVISQTRMTINPDYRGASSAVQAKLCLVQDIVVPQKYFNIDKLDGTGPSGFNIDLTKMQMIGMQWSWYAVGFIDFMLRGSDGNFIFFHRIRNSNVNTEAYMRTGNQAVRYEVINESSVSKLANSITASQTTIPLVDASLFPNESGTVYIDNELIEFSGKSGNNLINCTRAAPQTLFTGGSKRTFTAGTASTHEYNTGVILVSNTISPIISHWGSAMLTDGLFDTDRGYLFNYASTGISVSTTKATAFLIRLAPSVSNAIVGDLGDRELLNRAQLLLQTIEVTSDTGTGGIVVEGVLNPQNYPTDPANISWGGLSGLSQGGQPSFAQIAPGGSANWASGITQTTSTVATAAQLSATATTIYTSGQGANYLFMDPTTWVASNVIVGSGVSEPGNKIPANTTVTQIINNNSYYVVYLSQTITGNVNNGVTCTFTLGGTLANTNYLYFAKTLWENLSARVGQSLAATETKFPAGTRIQSISNSLTFGSTQYYRVNFTQNSNTSITAATAIAFSFGQPPYALPGETVFSFVSAPGGTNSLDLSQLKELTNTTLGGRGTYPNGPDVLAINVYKVSGTAITSNIVLRWGEAQA